MNVATGNARVGVQAGQVFGGIQVGAGPRAPTGLTDQITDFRGRLRQAHLAGDLDDSTYEAAEAELDVVTGSLGGGIEGGDSRLMVALKRLRGLIADIAELAASLAAIISAVRGTS